MLSANRRAVPAQQESEEGLRRMGEFPQQSRNIGSARVRSPALHRSSTPHSPLVIRRRPRLTDWRR